MSADGLPGMPVAPPAPKKTPDERMRDRQSYALRHRGHPLGATLGTPLALHPEAAPADDRDAPGRRCGNCVFRNPLHHHDANHPKCHADGGKRITHGLGTDVRAWWPACVDHQHKGEVTDGH